MRSALLFGIVGGLACLLTIILLGNVLSALGLGPHWVEYQSPTGIPYACMYESEEDFITITLEQGVYAHDFEE